MKELILAGLTFVFVYLIYLFLIILRHKKMEKYKTSTEVKYLQNKYKLNLQKINLRLLVQNLALTNSFIIAVTILIIGFVDNLVLKLCVGFVVLFPLIIITYNIIGIVLSKKYGKKVKNV
ncbi:MAG: hypothetical protein RR847_00745 [Bacilli bacterium]